jgi:hypothetical protein
MPHFANSSNGKNRTKNSSKSVVNNKSSDNSKNSDRSSYCSIGCSILDRISRLHSKRKRTRPISSSNSTDSNRILPNTLQGTKKGCTSPTCND